MTRILLAAALVPILAAPLQADQKLDEAVKKAEDQLLKGKPDDAVATLKKLVSQTPTPEAFLALAHVQERAVGPDDAADSLQKAVAAAGSAGGPVQANALAALASMDLRRGLGKDALTHANAAVKAQETGASLGALARAQAHSGDGPSALKTGDRAVQVDASSAAAHVGRGEALMALHRYDDAAQEFQKAVGLDPKMNLALIRESQADAHSHDPLALKRAVDEGRKAADADQKSGEAFAALGMALLAADPQKNWDEAIGQAQQGATVLDPKDPEVQVEVGKILEARGNMDQAAAAYQRAAQQDPAYTTAREALVRALYMAGKGDQAIADAQALVKEYPNSGDTLLLLGRMLLQKKSYIDAQVALEKAVPLAPTAEGHALLGTADQFTYRSAEALDHYKEAVRLDPQNLDYQTTYGLLLGVNKQYDAAAEVLKKVVASPNYKGLASAYSNLGWVYRNTEPHKTPEAIAAYKRALELDPKSAQAALGLGWAYTYAKDWDNAAASFQKAATLDPTTAGEADDGLAWCFFFRKDMAQAKSLLEKATTEGRPDTPLKTSIERVEKIASEAEREKALRETEGPKAEAQGPSLDALVNQLRRGSAAQKIQAAGEMGHVPGSVPFLCYALFTEPEVSVRDAVVVHGLGAGLGCSAEAKVCLNKALAAPPPAASVVVSKQDMQIEALEHDLKIHIKDVLAKCH
jgi:tetratricopeptide (TPR) repeat protein